MHCYTYSGHPVCSAVALATLGVLEKEQLVARAAHLGERLHAGLRKALADEFALPSGSAAHADVHLTGWYWCALAAVVLVVGAFALAASLATKADAMTAGRIRRAWARPSVFPSEFSAMSSVSAPSRAPLERIPYLQAGQWNTSASTRTATVFNPSSGKPLAHAPLCSSEETASVIVAAHEAFASWAETPVVERARLMFKYRELLLQHFDEITMTVVREHGKTLIEAKAGLQRGIEVVEFACGGPTLLMGETLPQIARGVDAETVLLGAELAGHRIGQRQAEPAGAVDDEAATRAQLVRQLGDVSGGCGRRRS